METETSKQGVLIGLVVLLAAIIGIVALVQSDPEPLQDSSGVNIDVDQNELSLKDDTYIVEQDLSEINWEGNKLGGGHTGVVDLKNGTMTVVGGLFTEGEFAINLASIKTVDDGEGNQKLDDDLKSENFFDVDNNPEATFVTSSISPLGGDQYQVIGTLKIRGISNEIEFPATVTVDNEDRLIAEAVIEVEREQFEVGTDKKLADIALTDSFTLDVRLVANVDTNGI